MKKIILYGYPKDCKILKQYLKNYEVQYLEEQEELIPVLMEECPAAVWVLMENAAGMEGVMAIRRIYPELPVVWFSNDSGFAPQAYRLQVDYFAPVPLNEDKINTALRKCGLRVSAK